MPRKAPVNLVSFEGRCLAQSKAKRLTASRLPLGPERDSLEREARQYETASDMQVWLASPAPRLT